MLDVRIINKNYMNEVIHHLMKDKKFMHSIDYVLKIIDEFDYTLQEVAELVNAYTGRKYPGCLYAIGILRQHNAKDIRKILQHT